MYAAQKKKACTDKRNTCEVAGFYFQTRDSKKCNAKFEECMKKSCRLVAVQVPAVDLGNSGVITPIKNAVDLAPCDRISEPFRVCGRNRAKCFEKAGLQATKDEQRAGYKQCAADFKTCKNSCRLVAMIDA